MLKGQQLSSLVASTAPSHALIRSTKLTKHNVLPLAKYIASPRPRGPVQCQVSNNKDTGATSSKLVAKATERVESWLSEDFDFHDFYDRKSGGDGNNERSVSFYKITSFKNKRRELFHFAGIYFSIIPDPF